ncbi:MAG: hypothetical protein IJ400_03410 [Clostridia bacterium]|nr:hypothetical protein [Clostridia bacterium]
MDETQMIENKTLVDKLYSLRAGLSLVAVKNDEIEHHENVLRNIKNEKYTKKTKLNNKRNQLIGARWQAKEKMWAINNEIYYRSAFLKKELKVGSRFKRVFNTFFEFFEESLWLFFTFLIWVTAIIIPIIAIYDAVQCGKMKKELKQLASQLRTDTQIEEEWKNSEEYIRLTKAIEEVEIKIADCESEKKLFYDDKVKRIESKEAIIKETCDCSISLHNALISEYSSTLDQRDWSNIDLIIYNVETGRADTLKEALQQVDNYRNTEKIVGAIKTATQAICNTISMEQDRMIRLVNNCTDAVNSRLSTIDSSVKDLIKNDEMQYAMQRKAKLTSDELVKEVKELREKII